MMVGSHRPCRSSREAAVVEQSLLVEQLPCGRVFEGIQHRSVISAQLLRAGRFRRSGSAVIYLSIGPIDSNMRPCPVKQRRPAIFGLNRAAWPLPDIASTGLRGDLLAVLGMDVALPIVVGRGDETEVAYPGDPAQCLVRRRGPAAAGAEVDRTSIAVRLMASTVTQADPWSANRTEKAPCLRQ